MFVIEQRNQRVSRDGTKYEEVHYLKTVQAVMGFVGHIYTSDIAEAKAFPSTTAAARYRKRACLEYRVGCRIVPVEQQQAA